MFAENLNELASILNGRLHGKTAPDPVRHVETDTRHGFKPNTVFFALRGHNFDGASFLDHAARRGAMAAVVASDVDTPTPLPLIKVTDPLRALQTLAARHRKRFKAPLLAVTGSNGKTIFKDFLTGILGRDRFVISSPGSYNSQVGTALSLLRLQPEAEAAIIEVGVSQVGEMDHQRAMVQPDHGVLINIGMAHLEGFGSRKMIAAEKLKLFADMRRGNLLLPDDPLLADYVPQKETVLYRGDDAQLPRLLQVQAVAPGQAQLLFRFHNAGEQALDLAVDASFREVFATIEMGVRAAFLMGASAENIIAGGGAYRPPHARMEIWKAQNGAVLANDSYSSDPVSALAALRVFNHYPERRKIFIFGGMTELGQGGNYQHEVVGEEAARQGVDQLLTIGDLPGRTAQVFQQRRGADACRRFESVDACNAYLSQTSTAEDIILVKGPRALGLQQIGVHFKERLAQTVYYINLSRIRHNLMVFKDRVPPGTRVMVMLKAFAYGTDASHVANYLQPHVDFFGVAYTKEAVNLRRAGVSGRILVQLVRIEDVDEIVALSLQPVVFSLEVATALSRAAKAAGKTVKLHLKVDTGMGRFGVFPHQVADLGQAISALPGLEIEGLMTHFSAADDPNDDAFTQKQIDLFKQARDHLAARGIHPRLLHAAATSGVVRRPDAHFDMIRLGLGMYGIYPSPAVAEEIQLKCPIALVSRIGSLKSYPADYPVSYNRRFTTPRESRIAFVPLGYHDGLSRALSNKGYVRIAGKKAPIVGAVCMDFTPVDVTDIPEAKVGDPVLILGEWQNQAIRVEEIADLEGTIPYEILCRLSERIQRIYLLDED